MWRSNYKQWIQTCVLVFNDIILLTREGSIDQNSSIIVIHSPIKVRNIISTDFLKNGKYISFIINIYKHYLNNCYIKLVHITSTAKLPM